MKQHCNVQQTLKLEDRCSSHAFNRLRQRYCNHCHSNVKQSFFFYLVWLDYPSVTYRAFKHWDLISEHQGNQAPRPPRGGYPNRGAERSTASLVTVSASSLSCHRHQQQLALKHTLDLVYEFPACRADARFFCVCPLGSCLFSATSLELCFVFVVFFFQTNRRLNSPINRKPGAALTLFFSCYDWQFCLIMISTDVTWLLSDKQKKHTQKQLPSTAKSNPKVVQMEVEKLWLKTYWKYHLH